MGCRHDGAQAGFAFGYDRVCDSGSKYSFVKQLAAELHGKASVANDDWCDRGLAGGSVHAADIEAEIAELFFEIAGVLPEFVDELGLLLQNVKSCDTGGCNGGRMRGREQERTAPVIQKLDQVAGAADISAHCANRFGPGAYLNVDAAMNIEVVDGSASIASQDPGGVRIVDHHDRTVFFGQIT